MKDTHVISVLRNESISSKIFPVSRAGLPLLLGDRLSGRRFSNSALFAANTIKYMKDAEFSIKTLS